ncbi:MAG: type VI secretion system baseplate subunit TssK [Bryobacterales bacterium]|nr:type VI secretion system baseplate subunit TssK [Bryobacterales bacterium]
MRRLQPVLWTKGVFLTPQHLQAQDRFLESNLEFRLDSLLYKPWGFRTLQIEHAALANGEFAIASASGMFPDGMPFEIPAPDAAPPPRTLEDAWEPDQESLDVYLTVPFYREQGLNVSVTERGLPTRYLAEVLLLRDENSGLVEKPIQVARKNFRFLFEGESLEDNTVLPVARIKRSETGEYQVDSRFVPPLVDFAASEYLMAIARRLYETLTGKSSGLAGTRRQKNQTLADFSSSDIASFWLLYSVNTHLPQFRHLFEARRGHPYRLYSEMLSLAAALTTFSSSVQPRDLPAYDHERLADCFAELDEKLRFLLETVVPANWVALPLEVVQPFVWAVALDEERFFNKTHMFLAISADMNRGELLARAPQLLKVYSADNIAHLIRQALPGVEITHVPKPPNTIPVKLNYEYFSLNQQTEWFQAIRKARNLAAYVPADFPNPQLELVILLPQSR